MEMKHISIDIESSPSFVEIHYTCIVIVSKNLDKRADNAKQFPSQDSINRG